MIVDDVYALNVYFAKLLSSGRGVKRSETQYGYGNGHCGSVELQESNLSQDVGFHMVGALLALAGCSSSNEN